MTNETQTPTYGKNLEVGDVIVYDNNRVTVTVIGNRDAGVRPVIAESNETGAMVPIVVHDHAAFVVYKERPKQVDVASKVNPRRRLVFIVPQTCMSGEERSWIHVHSVWDQFDGSTEIETSGMIIDTRDLIKAMKDLGYDVSAG